jgi:uncharacterized membrane protein
MAKAIAGVVFSVLIAAVFAAFGGSFIRALLGALFGWFVLSPLLDRL